MTRVLVVDDDADVLESMKAVLETLLPELDVEAVASGTAALEVVERWHPDVVVTDYRMPGMNGLELARRARRRDPGLPVILVTAFGGNGLEEEAEQAGVANFLRKPFSPSVLADAVAQAMP